MKIVKNSIKFNNNNYIFYTLIRSITFFPEPVFSNSIVNLSLHRINNEKNNKHVNYFWRSIYFLTVVWNQTASRLLPMAAQKVLFFREIYVVWC